MGAPQDFDEVVDTTFLETVKNAILEHYPKLVGIASFAAAYELFLHMGNVFDVDNIFKEDLTWFFGPFVSGYLGYKLTDHFNKLCAYKKRWGVERIRPILKEAPYERSSTGIQGFFDILFENPRRVGLGAGILGALGFLNLAIRWRAATSYFNQVQEPIPPEVVAQYKLAFAVRAASIPFAYSLVGLSDKILSSLLHSQNRELTRKIIPAFFYGTLSRWERFNQKYREHLEGIVETSVYMPATHDFTSVLIDLGRADEGFRTYLDGVILSQERGKMPYTTWEDMFSLIHDINRLEAWSYCEKELEKDSTPENYLSLAFTHLRLNNPDGAVSTLNDFSEMHEEYMPHAGVLKIEIWDGVEERERAKQELEALFSFLTLPEHKEKYEKDFMAETTRQVYVFGDSEFIRGSILFKEDTSREDFDFEVNLIESLEALISKHEKYELPVQVGDIFDYQTAEDEKRFVYAERFVPSQSLLQKLKEQSFEELEGVFEGITDYLALLHSSEVLESATQTRLDFAAKLEKKLADENFGCPAESARRIIDNYAPVLNAFTLEEAICVFNKDAHPENWLIAEDGTIVAIDFQDKGMVPMQLDLVNLIEYGHFTTYGEKIKVVTDYIDSYNKHKGQEVIKDRKQFMLIYLNAVVQRAISLSSAWSSPHRPTMWDKRHIVIDNALDAIDKIQRFHSVYYTQYKENYDVLRQELNGMRGRFMVQGKA